MTGCSNFSRVCEKYGLDGEGVTYQYQETIPGNSYPLDDDLVIWLKKKLSIVSSDGGDYYLERQEEPIPQDEQVLFDGISDDAAKKKGMERIKPFRVYIKDSNQSVLGGATGVIFFMTVFMLTCCRLKNQFEIRDLAKKSWKRLNKLIK